MKYERNKNAETCDQNTRIFEAKKKPKYSNTPTERANHKLIFNTQSQHTKKDYNNNGSVEKNEIWSCGNNKKNIYRYI